MIRRPPRSTLLSLHDALPIYELWQRRFGGDQSFLGRSIRLSGEQYTVIGWTGPRSFGHHRRSEEHTSELQSQSNLVCRLLLEKKKKLTGSTFRSFVSTRALLL